MLRSTLPASVAFQSDFAEDLLQVKVDGTQIHQILVNLCTNASHAMENGGMLTVRLENADLTRNLEVFDGSLGPGVYVKLSVSDTGPGISENDLPSIFDPYFTTKELGKGSGLGLSVVWGIVKTYGGGIRVSSEPGKGSRFEIYLPAVSERPSGPEPEAIQEVPAGSETILFVDDEEGIVELNRQRLEGLGYTVTGTSDPDYALQCIQERPKRFDLVITDMTMPKRQGDSLAREILKIRPDMPIILCTGHSDRISEDSAQDFGLAKYLHKPMDLQSLAVSVREALDRL